MAVRLTIWNEFIHERRDASVREIYPDGMHTVVAAGIQRHLGEDVRVRFATLDQPEHGLTEEVLDDTDVLTWWGHCAHDEVADAIVDRVVGRVLEGMGLVAMHSAHYSKVFRRLMGTTCGLRWRNENDRELVWSVRPAHPICAGIPSPIVIPRQEMYGEYFDIPQPDELIFVSRSPGERSFGADAASCGGAGASSISRRVTRSTRCTTRTA